ncbi:dsDNA nuclease domain-containing protein [Pseudomonas aeruginosa]|nr:dsDNA nuclease domain-containing protein [Pseudomonas aeruginosa]MDF5967254.1 dsDNA nuclease domain-containing protein [Pseudomonas aeruginosa]
MKLHEVTPREQNGRDTIDRFRAQFKAASLESLALLENGEMDRVYCDVHEDYVVKHIVNSKAQYRFVQVKTKSKLNYQYSMLEIFGLKKSPGRTTLNMIWRAASQGSSCFMSKNLAKPADQLRFAPMLTSTTKSNKSLAKYKAS